MCGANNIWYTREMIKAMVSFKAACLYCVFTAAQAKCTAVNNKQAVTATLSSQAAD